MTTNIPEAVQRILDAAAVVDAEGSNLLQPAILMNLNIDHGQVEEYVVHYLNPGYAPDVNKLLQEGFVAFRIQTEIDLNGHMTMIYLAKLKK